MIKNIKIPYIGLIIALAVIVIDQLTKHIALSNLKDVGNIKILPFFDLTLVYNKGISFGMLNSGSFWQLAIISIITVIITTAMIIWLFRTKSKYNALCIGLIIGGAIGNAIDRFFHEGVIDFLDFFIGSYHYPAFNFADSCIVVSVVLLLLEDLIIKDSKK